MVTQDPHIFQVHNFNFPLLKILAPHLKIKNNKNNRLLRSMLLSQLGHAFNLLSRYKPTRSNDSVVPAQQIKRTPKLRSPELSKSLFTLSLT